jgi:hypothetical protein
MSAGDVGLARAVIEQHADLRVGLADASIVVLAQRHALVDVLTLDQRHFRVLESHPVAIQRTSDAGDRVFSTSSRYGRIVAVRREGGRGAFTTPLAAEVMSPAPLATREGSATVRQHPTHYEISTQASRRFARMCAAFYITSEMYNVQYPTNALTFVSKLGASSLEEALIRHAEAPGSVALSQILANDGTYTLPDDSVLLMIG